MQPEKRRLKLSYRSSYNFIHYLADQHELILQPDSKKHLITAFNEAQERVFDFRLPLPFPPLGENLPDYLQTLEKLPPPYLTFLIQAGNSALGYFEGGEIRWHKVIRKYMTRKKQGKAQIMYLKTKGKSRAGSRIRLANTVAFFEEINEKLNDWYMLHPVSRILYSCPATLWGVLFRSKTKPPFDKKDSRLRKIPLDVHVPNFEELLRVNRFALSGVLRMEQDYPLEFFCNRHE